MKGMKRFLSVAMLLIALVALAACAKSKDAKAIDCKEFIDVKIKGFEGSGYPVFEMNSKFAQDRDYMDKMFPDLLRAEAEKVLQKIYKQLKIQAEPEKGLKNGDTVSIKVDGSSAQLLTENGLQLKNDTFSVKVSGLEEGQEFDPFSGLEVKFEGYDGHGDYSINIDSVSEIADKYGSFDWEYSKSGKLANGEAFRITYEINDEIRMTADKVMPSATKKEYIVTGLDPIKTIDPFDYYDIVYNGFDGKASVRLQAKKDSEIASGFWLCDVSVDPDEDVKNGDTLTLTIDTGSVDLSRYGLKLSETTKKVTVSGLDELEAIDPFTDDILVFSGKSPMIQLEIVKDKLPEGTSNYFTYYVNGENRYNKMTFEDGEEVTFTVEVSDYLQKKGYTVKETEKKIRAKGEGAYVTDRKEIHAILDTMKDPKEQLIPMVKALKGAYQSQWMGTMKEFEDLELEDVLLFTLKKDERAQLGNYNRPCFNKVLFVYRVKGTFDRNENVDHYVGYTYSDFEVDKDGKTTCKSDEGIEVARDKDRLLSVYKMNANYYDSVAMDGSEPTARKTKITVLTFTNETEKILNKYCELNPEFAEKYEIDCTVIESNYSGYNDAVDGLLKSGETPILYTADAAFVLRYTSGSMSSYAATYEDLGIDVEKKIKSAEIAQYSVDLGSRDGDVVALGYQSNGGAFIFNRSVAKDVFGTDDPDEIAAAIGPSWEKFFLAAEKCKQKGYAILSGESDLWHAVEGSSDKGWIVNDKLYIDPKREKYLDYAKSLYDNEYTNNTKDWTPEWNKDMRQEGPKKVLGFFGPAWLINSLIKAECGRVVDEKTGEELKKGTYGDWGVCQSPVGFFWGGTWLMANKAVLKDEKVKEGVRELIEFITLDTSDNGLQYLWANGKLLDDDGTKDCVASNVVMKRSNGEMEILGGQDAFPVFVEAAQYAKGDNVSEFDAQINDLWWNAVTDYMVGNLTRTQAIESFKSSVKNNLGISAN